MAYVAPYVDSTGLTIPSYNDIRDDLIAQVKTIYGNDVYIENDSADYQYISAVALKIHDTLQSVQLAYNSRSPLTAIGSGLDAIVKLNGIKRKSASYSTCQVTLAGTNGTAITNGVVTDVSGYKWSLPANVTIVSGGTVTVSAVCQTIGAITAQIGDINQIGTPTRGWVSVTNASAAIPGQPIEEDSELRSRQAISVRLPTQTLLAGTKAGIAAVDGVTRYVILENDTNLTDVNGLLSHSIAAIVEGGTDEDIANQIYLRKGIGCYTNGDTEIEIFDEYGIPTKIRFYRPVYDDIFTTITLKQLNGYTLAITDNIKTAVAEYLDNLDIGEDVTISSIWGAALSVMPSLKQPIFSIQSVVAGTEEDNQLVNDIIILFNHVARGNKDNIALVFV
jgi:uncharacterized phage protein gp47/JayE